MPRRQASAAAAAQRPVAAAAYAEKSCAAAWKAVPSWYLIATADRLITPEAQQYMARRSGAHTTEISASHAVALTQPAAVAGQIAAAATAPWAHSGQRT
jgi:pimeloyl-ACP methyl ester carboxylesterase